MLPSVDTYLSDEIGDKLKIILSNRYIIEEVLKGIQPNIAQNFIDTYCGVGARDIPIVYTMPQEKVTQQGAIYIGLREGEEHNSSLGNLEDIYTYKNDGSLKEKSIVKITEDGKRLYFEVSNPIGELINIENISFSSSDNVIIEKNRIYFNYDKSLLEMIEGIEFNVNYYPSTGEEQGLKKGFSSRENYSVLAISTNMDIVRCIDLVLKAIFILMRSNPSEKTGLLLQSLQFGQTEEIDIGTTDGKTPELLYGRETIVSYSVSYTLDAPLLNKIDNIELNLKLSEGE